MQMKIIYKDNKVNFSYLKTGDIFTHGDDIFAKIEPISEDHFERNAISLSTWEVVFVDHRASVELHPNATLTL